MVSKQYPPFCLSLTSCTCSEGNHPSRSPILPSQYPVSDILLTFMSEPDFLHMFRGEPSFTLTDTSLPVPCVRYTTHLYVWAWLPAHVPRGTILHAHQHFPPSTLCQIYYSPLCLSLTSCTCSEGNHPSRSPTLPSQYPVSDILATEK